MRRSVAVPGHSNMVMRAGLTQTEVGIVALRRFAPRAAAQRLWRRGKSCEKSVPTLHGSGLSQRDNHYLTPYTQSLFRHASALVMRETAENSERLVV